MSEVYTKDTRWGGVFLCGLSLSLFGCLCAFYINLNRTDCTFSDSTDNMITTLSYALFIPCVVVFLVEFAFIFQNRNETLKSIITNKTFLKVWSVLSIIASLTLFGSSIKLYKIISDDNFSCSDDVKKPGKDIVYGDRHNTMLHSTTGMITIASILFVSSVVSCFEHFGKTPQEKDEEAKEALTELAKINVPDNIDDETSAALSQKLKEIEDKVKAGSLSTSEKVNATSSIKKLNENISAKMKSAGLRQEIDDLLITLKTKTNMKDRLDLLRDKCLSGNKDAIFNAISTDPEYAEYKDYLKELCDNSNSTVSQSISQKISTEKTKKDLLKEIEKLDALKVKEGNNNALAVKLQEVKDKLEASYVSQITEKDKDFGIKVEEALSKVTDLQTQNQNVLYLNEFFTRFNSVNDPEKFNMLQTICDSDNKDVIMGLLQTKSKVFYGKNKGEIEQMCKGTNVDDILDAKKKKYDEKFANDILIKQLKDQFEGVSVKIEGESKEDKNIELFDKILEFCNKPMSTDVRKAVMDYIRNKFDLKTLGIDDAFCTPKIYSGYGSDAVNITPIERYLNQLRKKNSDIQSDSKRRFTSVVDELKAKAEPEDELLDLPPPLEVVPKLVPKLEPAFKHKKLTKRLLKKH